VSLTEVLLSAAVLIEGFVIWRLSKLLPLLRLFIDEAARDALDAVHGVELRSDRLLERLPAGRARERVTSDSDHTGLV
jgi:hypothetical protein